MKNNFYVFAFVFLFFSLGLVSSSSSVIKALPDICLSTDYRYYDIILDDYYNIDVEEEILISYNDPLNNNPLAFGLGYSTLNLDCWEMAYYYNGQDVLRLETYNESCSANILVKFPSDSSLNQNFDLTVSNDCNDGVTDPVFYDIANYSYLSSLNDDLLSFWNGDSINDVIGGSNLDGIIGNVFFNGTGIYGNAITSYSKYDFPYTSNFTGTEGFWSVSAWFRGNHSTGSTVSFNSKEQSGNRLYYDHVQETVNLVVDGQVLIYDYTGNLTHPIPFEDEWTHLVSTFNITDKRALIYLDGVVVANSTLGSVTTDYNLSKGLFAIGGRFGVGCCFLDGVMDSVAVWNRTLNFSEVVSLYNNGYGLDFTNSSFLSTPSPLPELSDIPNVVMSQNEYFTLDINDYFDNWGDYYVTIRDPINDYYYELWTGYSTLNADYYEVHSFANGDVLFTSYSRPYSTNLSITACSGDNYDLCVSKNLLLVIGGSLSSVEQINDFEFSYSLGETSSKNFAGNFFYKNYETLSFFINDSNDTGLLIPSFPFIWVSSGDSDYPYTINYNCSIGTDYNSYFEGDVNVSLDCGNNRTYFNISSLGNNYAQYVKVNASNSLSSLVDFFILNTGNLSELYDFESSKVVSSSGKFDEYVSQFSSLFSYDLSTLSKKRVVLVVSIFGFFVIFAIFYPFSIRISLLLAFGYLFIVFLFFAKVGYIGYAYPIFYSVCYSLYLVKFMVGNT